MARLKAPPAERLSDGELLAVLRSLAVSIEAVNADRERLYARRKQLWVEGRRRVPPIWTEALGDASGVKDSLVSATLNKESK